MENIKTNTVKIKEKLKIEIIIFLFLLLFILSCEERVNPYDYDSWEGVWNPTELNIVSTDSGSVQLTWKDNCNKEEGFKVYRKIDGENWQLVAVLAPNTASFTDRVFKTSLVYYRVAVYIDYLEWYVENSGSFDMANPSDLILKQVGASEISLEWKDNSIIETGFRIDRKIDTNTWETNYDSTASNTHAYTDTSITIGHQYTYRVFSKTHILTSGYTEAEIYSEFNPPTNLQLVQHNYTTINLTWTDNCSFEQGFKIERSLDSLNWQLVATIPADSCSYRDGSVRSNRIYYKVCAYSNGKNTDYAINLVDHNLPTPINFASIVLGENQVVVDWNLITPNCDYRIDRKKGNEDWQTIANLYNSRPGYCDNTAIYGNLYYYRICTVSNFFTSGYLEGSVLVQLQTPSNLQATQISANKIKIHWYYPYSYGQGFRLERKIANGDWAIVSTLPDNVVDAYFDFTEYISMKFRVCSFDGTHVSGYSNEVQITPTDLDYVIVTGGSFSMGGVANTPETSELPVHDVTVSTFYLSKYEITQELWKNTMGNNPAEFTGNLQRPVERVSWFDALKFCNKLSIYRGLTPCYSINGVTNPDSWADGFAPECNWAANGYRLPTEAEWEYAAKGGSNQQSFIYSGSNSINHVGWYDGNAGGTTHPVGLKDVNTIGTYDMSGNAWEWCWDWYGDYTGNAQINPTGPIIGSSRVARGGGLYGYGVDGSWCRNTNRGSDSPGSVNMIVGLRPCRNVN